MTYSDTAHGLVIAIEKEFTASPEQVFARWTDADALARWSTMLGRHVTCVRIVDGMHDLLLSTPPVRANAYAEIARWLDAYGSSPSGFSGADPR